MSLYNAFGVTGATIVAALATALSLGAQEPAQPPRPDTQPVVIQHPDPEFSDEARREKISGNVLLFVRIDAEGNVAEARVIRGLGHGLDEKALEAVRRYKFRPASKDGVPVGSVVHIEVSFQIYGQKSKPSA